MKKEFLIFLLFFFFVLDFFSQVTIINANINEYNITPNSLSQISLSNLSGSGKVKIEVRLTNSANKTLLLLNSNVVDVKTGITVFGVGNLSFITVNYSNSPQGEYIKNLHRLPNGSFNYCVRILPISGFENGDEYCESLNTSENDQLLLVNPSDEDIVDTKTPVLLWLHTEAFNLLSEGEFFRLTLVEMDEGQSASEALLINRPHYLKNYVGKHHVQYPLDGKRLEEGHKYAWQVQKVANGTILASTEAWSFSLSKDKFKSENVSITLKRKLDGTIYYVENDLIFFRFDERYKSSIIESRILNDKREEVSGDLENKKTKKLGSKSIGYNSYKLDLEPYGLKKGYYILEVENEKGNIFLIKFYVN